MGYSVSIRLKSPKRRNEILSFMEKHYRPWKLGPSVVSTITGVDFPNTQLGFHYGPFLGWEREYIYTILRWLAIRFGNTKKCALYAGTKLPYYLYDGCEDCYLLVSDKPLPEDTPIDGKDGSTLQAVDSQGWPLEPDKAKFLAYQSILEFNPKDLQAFQDFESKHASSGKYGDLSAAWDYGPTRDLAVRNIALIRDRVTELDRLWGTT